MYWIFEWDFLMFKVFLFGYSFTGVHVMQMWENWFFGYVKWYPDFTMCNEELVVLESVELGTHWCWGLAFEIVTSLWVWSWLPYRSYYQCGTSCKFWCHRLSEQLLPPRSYVHLRSSLFTYHCAIIIIKFLTMMSHYYFRFLNTLLFCGGYAIIIFIVYIPFFNQT